MNSSVFEILEDLSAWKETYDSGWLAAYQQSGEIDWKQYRPPVNKHTIPSPGIDLSASRLMLITSSGAYLPDEHTPFDAKDPLGDYSIRTLPSSTNLSSLSYAHEHYDQQAVKSDPQVLVPLDHLRGMAAEGAIGKMTHITSFMGYQPDVSRLIDETIPAILQYTQEELPDAALLVPS